MHCWLFRKKGKASRPWTSQEQSSDLKPEREEVQSGEPRRWAGPGCTHSSRPGVKRCMGVCHNGTFSKCGWIPHRGCGLGLPDDEWCWPSHPPVGHPYVFFGMSLQILCPFLNQIVWFFAIEFYKLFIYCGYEPLIRCMSCKYFLPFSRLPLHSVPGFLCWAEAS